MAEMYVMAGNKTTKIDWMERLAPMDEIMMQYSDDRTLSEICQEWEGRQTLWKISDIEGDMIWEGYTRLRRVARMEPVEPGKVIVTFVKNAEAKA